MSDIWIEKYRPTKLEEVVGNQQAILQLRAFQAEGSIPHLMLSGPSGTGKTTSINCLARSLLGDSYSKGIMELNASDERGIDVVRERIKIFAKSQVNLSENKTKIVILDEVDSMTEAAQQALRRLMEIYADSTRFALACNQSTKIIEPIQSRCAIVRFSRLSDDQVLKRLLEVCKMEKLDFVDSGLETLVYTAEGDMRNALNNLQSTVNGFGLVSKDNVIKVCDFPPPEEIKKIIEACLEVDWMSAHLTATRLIEKFGYTPLDIVGIMRTVLRRMTIKEHVALEFYKEIAKCHYIQLEGCPTKLQLDRLFCNLCRVCVKIDTSPP